MPKEINKHIYVYKPHIVTEAVREGYLFKIVTQTVLISSIDSKHNFKSLFSIKYSKNMQ